LLTKREVKISPVPFSTIEPNIAQTSVLDERLDQICEIVKPEKKTYAKIEFVDVAGLIEGAHKGEGLGNEFLAHLKPCDALLQVIRGFEREEVKNFLGEINPQKEIEVIKTELLMKDFEIVERTIEKEKKNSKKREVLEKIREGLARGIEIKNLKLDKEEIASIKEFQFLTLKPILYLLNGNLKKIPPIPNLLVLDLQMEQELLKLSEKEKEELGIESGIERLIQQCCQILNLVSFYTIAKKKEAKAWLLEKGSKIEKAAEKIHSDFVKFIKAEVLNFEKLLEIKDWQKAKEKGLIQIVGRDYIVKDGDIIEFKI
ncbi:redox-regulated ATPase YchF, partial [Candidatus Parcubacteria bacterium]|nr:redox-regulated ATPase YchF [Candidatus Parcubacteria bacterium]